MDNKIIIVDEFTGRLMHGTAMVRRPAPGGRGQGRRPRSRKRSQTLATITLQNFFKLYDQISGMTGTADDGSPKSS